ncbi:7444_t:CDS:2 [Funneliformis mosseae]|uniref:7444_t:CDS:1 n=1 Tax=Funneliformis mosseae TaxID=27381 RepID=A0A9N9F2D1_FUNMO|nr:7444_t:CDS:2 [Funneliformis mosseae]
MSSQHVQLQCARLTENNLREHTESFVKRKSLQEQSILDYVLEQKQINYEESQQSYDDYSSSDSETSRKTTLSGYSRYSVEDNLSSINSSLLISRSRLRKSKKSETPEIKQSKPCSKQRARKIILERRSPLRETSLNQRRSKHVQKEKDQRNKKFSRKEKDKSSKNHSRSAIKTNRRKSRKSRGLLASSQIMRNWFSDKLGTDRITLQPNNKARVGIFNKGKASEKVKSRGVPDLVFSEIDFLNSNPSRKRINQNNDDSHQDTDETSDSDHHKSLRNSTKRIKNKQKEPKVRGNLSNSKHYSEVKSTSSINSRYLDNDCKSSLGSNDKGEMNASSMGHARVDKMPKFKAKKNEISSHFVNGQNYKKPFKYALQNDKRFPPSNDIGRTVSPESSSTSRSYSYHKASRSRKEKKVTSSYFASNQAKDCLNECTPKDKHKPTEQIDKFYPVQTVDSFRAVDAEKQSQIGNYQEDSKVDKIAPKYEESSGKVPMKLDEDSTCSQRCLPVNKGTKDPQNNHTTLTEENDSEKMHSRNSDSEKMVVDFNPSWIKRKSLLLNKLSKLQNQNTAKSNEHQSSQIYRAVIAEGAKIERSNMTTGLDQGLIDLSKDKEEELEKFHNNSSNIELGNNVNVKDDGKICQEIFARDDHMYVDLFDEPIQSKWTYQENINDTRHKDRSKCDTAENTDDQLTLDMQYKSNNALVYGGIGHEGSFEDSNIYPIPTSFEDHQYWIPSNEFPMCDSRIIPQTSMMENQVPWNWMLQYQHNTDVIHANNNSSVNNYGQTWEDSIDNSLYIDTEYPMYDENNSTSHNDIEGVRNGETNIAACFVWKKHRLH